MATGETGFDDVTFDLISVQYHSLKAGHDYGQYVRDARNAGKDEIAQFFGRVMLEELGPREAVPSVPDRVGRYRPDSAGVRQRRLTVGSLTSGVRTPDGWPLRRGRPGRR